MLRAGRGAGGPLKGPRRRWGQVRVAGGTSGTSPLPATGALAVRHQADSPPVMGVLATRHQADSPPAQQAPATGSNDSRNTPRSLRLHHLGIARTT